MKKLTCIALMLLVPMIGFAQDAKKEGPKKATISVERIIAKDGEDAALKAAIGAHAQKYHTGNWKWRVSEILTGPDAGGYQIVEGPNSWTHFEGRGDLGAEHLKDYETNIAAHTKKHLAAQYYTYKADLSTVAASDYSSTKTLITRVFVKPGRSPAYMESLKTWKKVWEKRGANVAVWSLFYSGESCFIIAHRLKNGWKDLDEDTPHIRKVADEIGGPGTFDKLMEANVANIDRIVGEMIEFKADLSSK